MDARAGSPPSSYSNCSDDCDASVAVHDAGKITHVDGAADAGMVDDTGAMDDGSSGDASLGDDGSCGAGFIVCDGGCADPSNVSSCGACGNACGGDASLCATEADGSFVCASSCPPNASTLCGASCVDTTQSAENCQTCGNACTTGVQNAHPTCVISACTFACNEGYSACQGSCIDFLTDNGDCGGCGSTFACTGGKTCVSGACQIPGADAGQTDAGQTDASVPCPGGGCPNSTMAGFSCTPGGCNAASGACTASGQGCYCTTDAQCPGTKCVKVTGQNDLSCTTCTGGGAHDGFDCALGSAGIPVISGGSASCPAGSGFDGTTLTCDSTRTSCYCNADGECPSGKCIPSATHNASCSPGGPCTGSGTADYRGCQATGGFQSKCNGIGYCGGGTCSTGVCNHADVACLSEGVCLCTSDSQCDSGKCVVVSGSSGNSSQCGSNCTGSGSSDSNSCQIAPGSVACSSSGTFSCTTSLTPAPVPNSGNTACVCVANSNCPSGKCVSAGQCSGTNCSGSGAADSEQCQLATSTAGGFSCSIGNCKTVTSPSGTCSAAGVPCWCTADSQCPSGDKCSSWAGCAAGACTGAGTGNAFNCVP